MGLDGVELVLKCEDTFGIKLPDKDAAKVVTVRDLQHLCARLVRERRGVEALPPEEESRIHEEVRVLIADQMGFKLDRVVPDANFVKDLGID